jgi:hypothetical protein
MLFAPNGLASGPQVRFYAEEKGTKVKGDKPQISLDRFWPFVVMASSKSRSDFGGQGPITRVVGPSAEKEDLNEVDGSGEVVQ